MSLHSVAPDSRQASSVRAMCVRLALAWALAGAVALAASVYGGWAGR